MEDFDEPALADALQALPAASRVAFAAAAAARQRSSHERFARARGLEPVDRFGTLLDALWLAQPGSALDRDAWAERLDEVMALMPDEDEPWQLAHALAEDALASLAYAVRCLLDPKGQEAAWAARRAYEAADQAAIRSLGARPGTPGAEQAIKAHEFVQRELARQRRDLALLRAGAVDDVRRHALAEELLTEQETRALE